MVILGIILGVLGLIAGILSAILAYFTFVDPRKRLTIYLNDIAAWESLHTTLGGHDEVWRYAKHPEFAIEIKDDSRDWDAGAKEPWMAMPLPDPKKTMYMVHVTINGTVLYAEKFIALDGWRYFIPLPRIDPGGLGDESRDDDATDVVDNRTFFYDDVQLKLSRIIGKFHNDKSIEEFAKLNNIAIGRIEK